MRVLLFGGTTEGRKLAALFARNKIEVVLQIATEYGRELQPKYAGVEIIAGRLTSEEMAAYMTENRFDYVVDTTHPYADIVTKNIRSACEKTNTAYIRLVREKYGQSDEVIYVDTVREAAAFLDTEAKDEKILLAIGSKALGDFTILENYADRLYVRMIPMIDSLQKAEGLGYKSANFICMQGPFDIDMNKAVIKMTGAGYLVTKESGDAGGFYEKIEAARQMDCKAVVIARPEQESGRTYKEILEFFNINEDEQNLSGGSLQNSSSQNDSLQNRNLRNDSSQNISLQNADVIKNNRRRPFFPLFLNLKDKRVVVVGGGKIAQRRICALLEFGADILVISPEITEELKRLAEQGKIRHIENSFKPGDLEEWKPFFVLAATDKREVNKMVANESESLGIPHSIADCMEESDAYFPAIAQSSRFIAGIISKDGNHRAVKDVAEDIRSLLNGK